MSHTTEISGIVFRDVEALTLAVNEMAANGIKCSLVANATPRAYYENQQGLGKADYVLTLKDSPYDVGFYKDEKKGGFVARTDLFMGHVAKVLGVTDKSAAPAQAALGRLYSTYAVHATMRQAARGGQTVRRINNPDGSVRLAVTGY